MTKQEQANTGVEINPTNQITFNLKTDTLSDILTSVTLLPSVHTSFSVTILNRRLNEKHFRLIAQALSDIGMKPLDLTYDTWGKDIYAIQDTETQKLIGIPFNTAYSAQNWLDLTFKSTKPDHTTNKQEELAYKAFKEAYRVVHLATV